jgi:hypothetical protein
MQNYLSFTTSVSTGTKVSKQDINKNDIIMKIKDKKILGNILVLTVYALLGTFMVSCNKDDYATIYNPDNTKSIRPGMLTLNFTGSTLSDTSTTTTITMISTAGKTT